MNVLYLERFFYVAKSGGVAEGHRNLPRRIDLSALSRQLTALEEDLGLVLFERRPFALTSAGQELFDEIRPFFEKLPGLPQKLRSRAGLHLGIGAPEIVLRDYLAQNLADLRKKFPGLQLVLRDGDHASLEERLRRREINVAVTIFDREPVNSSRRSRGDETLIHSESRDQKSKVDMSLLTSASATESVCALPLLDLPVALVVPPRSKIKSPEDLWKNGCVSETVLMLPLRSAITRHFQEGLKQRQVGSFPTLELETTDMIEEYVRKGHGVGVSVAMPNAQKMKGLRVVPLKDFAPVRLGILWQQPMTAPMTAFIEMLKAESGKIAGHGALS